MVALLLATSAPYLIGATRDMATSPVTGSSAGDAGWRFTGFLFGVEDGHSYLAKMRQGARGDFAFRLPYTTEPHTGTPLIFLPYMITGWLAGRIIPEADAAHTDALIVAFHVLRVVCAGLLLAALWRFTGAFIRAPRPRLVAFVIACVGGGLGWLVLMTGSTETLGLPPEFYIPEGFGLLPLYGLPHIALGRAALLWGLAACLIPAGGQGRQPDRSPLAVLRRPLAGLPARPIMTAAICWIVVGLCVPFYLAILYVVLTAWVIGVWVRDSITLRPTATAGLWSAFPARLTVRVGLPAVLTLPLFAYYALAFAGNPALVIWSAQNILQSPSPLVYGIGYAPLIALAAFGVRAAWRRAGRSGGLRHMLLIAWPLIVPVLVYLPINVQRRMAEAVIVPLAILAAYGLERINRNWPIAGLTFALCISTLLMLGSGMLAAGLAAPARPIFIPAGDAAALAWLHDHAPARAVVVSSHETGNLIPAYTHTRAYIGLGTETLAYEDKLQATDAFFSSGGAAGSTVLDGGCLPADPRLCAPLADYIAVLSAEYALAGGAFTPPLGWVVVYESAGRTIYGRELAAGG